MSQTELLKLIQGHKALESFDYAIAVNWAVEMVEQGNESENILMLATFTQPFHRWETGAYVTAVLKELGLEELDYDEALIATTHFHLSEIVQSRSTRKHLSSLYQLCINNDYKSDLMAFYSLYHAWDELEEFGQNYYYTGADLSNIEELLRKEANQWVDEYIHGIKVERPVVKKTLQRSPSILQKGGLKALLKSWFS